MEIKIFVVSILVTILINFLFIGFIYYKIVINLLISYFKSLDLLKEENPEIKTNEEIINNMTNSELLIFLKDRLDLQYCRMCNKFSNMDCHQDVCRFFYQKDICDKGFEKWLKDTNNLEGDMNAKIQPDYAPL